MIQYDLPVGTRVQLTVFDLLGREIATLVNGEQPRGTYAVRFEAGGLASGVYLYRLTAGNFSATKKLLLVR